MNAPALRTESPLERRMKRDLRRYITAYHRAYRCLKASTISIKYELRREISQIPMPTAHRGDISNMTEHRIGMMCAEVRLMIEQAQESATLHPWDCLHLVERCKGRLTATRRDKELS